MTITFEQKVLAMTAKEVILLMVSAVENPVIKLDFDTFGEVYDDVCYGCAATNAVCKISGVVFDKTNIEDWHHAEAVNAPERFISHFELAIDSLSSGDVDAYNNLYAKQIGMAKITRVGFEEDLPRLGNDFTKAQLKVYKRLAAFQEKK